MMAISKSISLRKIVIPERLRTVDEDHALAIQASIVEHGLLNPVTVRQTPNGERGYTLVAGDTATAQSSFWTRKKSTRSWSKPMPTRLS